MIESFAGPERRILKIPPRASGKNECKQLNLYVKVVRGAVFKVPRDAGCLSLSAGAAIWMLRMCYSHLGATETEYIPVLICRAKWSQGMNNSAFKKKKKGWVNQHIDGW